MDYGRYEEVPREVKSKVLGHRIFVPNEDETEFVDLNHATSEQLSKYKQSSKPYSERKWNVYAVYEHGKEDSAFCHMMISSRHPVDYYYELTRCGHHNRIRSDLTPQMWMNGSSCYLVHSCEEVGRKPAEEYRKWARNLSRPY